MLNRLGGLNERFLDLFLRALTFQPIRDINSFVEQWLLDARPLDVDALQKVVERLGQLRITAREVEQKVAALQTIVEWQAEVRGWHGRHAEYSLLAAFLRVEEARRRAAELSERHMALVADIGRAEAACAETEGARRGADAALLEAEVRLRQSDIVRRREELSAQIAQLAHEARELAPLRGSLPSLAPLLEGCHRAVGPVRPARPRLRSSQNPLLPET
ncbi:hypothetical protein SE17_06335 [Kouleothrix aurantiaca]|uniref:Uncharacterized protein n=1 Tax=Kouleothrix aurantiaca TaxID=186479 RepID=A0A0P9FLD1_9CHLR|nr:hypothetical protein SE17_06335 [Kouleothrix aurantiaca]